MRAHLVCAAVALATFSFAGCRGDGDDDDTPTIDGSTVDGGDGGMVPDGAPIDAPRGDGGPRPSLTPGATDRFLIQGVIVTPAGPITGELLVEGTNITCVAASCSAMAGASGATVIRTSGFVMPGMLDSHNHGLFNFLDEADWTPTMFWGDHDDWTVPANEPRYAQVLDAKQYLASEGTSPVDFRCEMDKFAEVKALISGTTSMVLAPGAIELRCYGSAARTIDTQQNDLPDDKLQVSASLPDNATAMTVCNRLAAGTADAYIVHIGEGINPTALNEWDTLKARASGCLIQSKVAIIHGTAFDASRFAEMGAANMGLIWSPKSNMFLYNDTTRIDLAIAGGVTKIALAPDWSLGGSVNLLDELRFADQIDTQKFGNMLTARRLFEMVTKDAAKVMAVDAMLGTLEVGKRADLFIVNGDPTDPYQSLLAARPESIELTMVDGRAMYGDPELMAAGPAIPGCEALTVCGAPKFICLAEASTADKLNQTWAQVLTALGDGLTAYDALVAPAIAPMSPLPPNTKCN